MTQHSNRNEFLTESEDTARSARIAFVQSCWHRDIVDQSRIGFLRGIKTQGFETNNVECLEVPGAFEIPLQAKLLALSGRYAAIVAAGFVVDGGIYRHEFVASSVIDGLMRVQLETEVPIISVVLTPQHFHEHNEHRDFFANTSLSRERKPRWPVPRRSPALGNCDREPTHSQATPAPRRRNIESNTTRDKGLQA
jgi:6,7-dimethyl-8-ribityllumazine synthase